MVRLLRSGQTVAKVYGNLKRKVCTEFADYISTKKPFQWKDGFVEKILLA